MRRNATRKSAPLTRTRGYCSLHLVVRTRRVTECRVQLTPVAAARRRFESPSSGSASIDEEQCGDQREERCIDVHEEPEQSIRAAVDHPEGMLAFATSESRSEI